MIILMCGGREFRDRLRIEAVFDAEITTKDIVVEGGAEGADELINEICFERGIPCATVEAHWRALGNKAGPIRNGWMLRLRPNKVIAFPGGTGTADMVRQAQAAGIEVKEIK